MATLVDFYINIVAISVIPLSLYFISIGKQLVYSDAMYTNLAMFRILPVKLVAHIVQEWTAI